MYAHLEHHIHAGSLPRQDRERRAARRLESWCRDRQRIPPWWQVWKLEKSIRIAHRARRKVRVGIPRRHLSLGHDALSSIRDRTVDTAARLLCHRLNRHKTSERNHNDQHPCTAHDGLPER